MKAKFELAYKDIALIEGGYANISADRGGETYAGIARNFHPSWEGWAIIDEVKKEPESVSIKWLNSELQKDTKLQELKLQFYKDGFFDAQFLSYLPQKLANEVFEQSVNLGKGRTGEYLQKICNALNYSSKNKVPTLFTDLKVDGAIGKKTINAVAVLLENGIKESTLIHSLNAMQANHYINLASQTYSQRMFVVGWLKRT